MKRKIALAVGVLAFAAFSLVWSCAGYGKKVSENTSGTVDGRILVCRKYAEIGKVIAIDGRKKSRKKEVTLWNYDADSGELAVDEDLSDFFSPIFHVEGKPSEPPQFILREMDLSRGPVGVFLNGKVAAENREFVIDEGSRILTLKIPPKELSSIVIAWHTGEGLASISEMSRKEADLYAELEGAWFTESAKKQIAARTEEPSLEFSEEANEPRVVMSKISEERRRKMLDEFPVNAYKFRRDAGMGSLSREAGFKISLPKKCGGYKIVSAMLIESAFRGEVLKSVEFSYDKSDFFSPSSICVEAGKYIEGEDEKIEYPISSETLELKVPVRKQVCWSIASEGANPEQTRYRPQRSCLYSWNDRGTWYKIFCMEDRAAETEEFLREMLGC